MASIRRRLKAFYDRQEEDFREIVAALITDRVICSTMQRRVLWVRNRSKSFTNNNYRILGRPGMEKKFLRKQDNFSAFVH